MRKPLLARYVWIWAALLALPARAAGPEAPAEAGRPPIEGEKPAAEAGAPEEAGLVVALRGEATAALPGREKRGLELKSAVYAGDVIRTKARSRIQLCFKDQTTVTIGQKARLVIDAFVYNPGDAKSKVETSLDVGAFKVLGGAVSKLGRDRITIKTPTATIGIRGTLVIGEEGAEGLQVVFLGGRGAVVRNGGGAIIMAGRSGLGVKVRRGAAPPPPRSLSQDEIRTLQDKVAIGIGQLGARPVPRRPGEEPVLLRQLASLDGSKEKEGEGKDEGEEDSPLRKEPPPLETPLDAILAEAATASQEAAAQTLEDFGLVGHLAAYLLDDSFTTRTNDRLWSGPVMAFNVDGVIQGHASAGGEEIPFSLPAVPLATGGVYTGAFERTIADSLVLRGAPRVLETCYAYDNLGEFAAFFRNTPVEGAFSDGSVSYEYFSAAYMGTLPPGLPSSGVYYYGAVEEDQAPGWATSGGYAMAIDDLVQTTLRGEQAEFGVGVNFRNRRVIGLFTGSGNAEDFFFYGTVDGDGKIDAVCLGQAYERSAGDWEVWDGSMHGGIFGSSHQGLGLHGTGASWSANTGSRYLDWTAVGAAFRINADSTTSSPSGVHALVGWATGVALDIGGGAASPYYTYNDVDTDVSFLADADAGTLSGVLRTDGGTLLTDLTVGGTTLSDSAYVDPQLFAARLGGGAASIDVDGGYTGPLRSTSNFLLALPEIDLEGKPWVAMGEWEIRFDHPMNGTHHLADRRFSYFVVGAKTPSAYVANLIGTAATGTYAGPARATFINAPGTTVNQLAGSVSLDIDFGAQTFTGDLDFTSHDLVVSGSVDAAGLTGTASTFDAQPVTASQIKGTFYGPQAESAGGNFYALKGGGASPGERLIGVYVGHKQ